MPELSDTQINDIITGTIIKTLKIIQQSKDEGEDLNTIDFEYIIDCRYRDMTDKSLLENLTMPEDQEKLE